MVILRKSRYIVIDVILIVFLKYIIDLETEGGEWWIMFWLLQISLSCAEYEKLQTEEEKQEASILAVQALWRGW